MFLASALLGPLGIVFPPAVLFSSPSGVQPEHWAGSPGGQIRRDVLDFPGGPVGKNLPANAGDVGWIPGPGRSHTRQLSPWATATETSHSRACAPQQEKPPQREACAPQLESSPCSMQPD